MAIAAPPAVEHKLLRLHRPSIKTASGAGSVSGYLSLWDIVDGYGDVVIRGAYAKTIPTFVQRGSLLHEHDPARVIGTISDAREDSTGLWIEAAFHGDAESQRVRQVVSERLDRGKHTGLSIGYIPTEVSYRAPRAGEVLPDWVDQVRELRRIDLFEGSIVMMPALADAGVASVKSAAGGPLDMVAIAQRLASRGVTPLPTPDRRSFGERVASSSEVKAFLAGHAPNAVLTLKDVSLKALATSLPTPADVRADRLGAVAPAPDFLSFLPVLPTESSIVRVIQVTATNNAAPIAEATATTGTSGLKPESGLAFPATEVPVESVPTWVPVTRQVLDDAAGLQNIVDAELARMLRSVVEAQVAAGNGTRPNLHGISGWPGVTSIAVGAGGAVGALVSAVAAVRTSSGYDATVIGVEPTAWAALLLASSTAASGTLGAPGVTGAPNILGVPIVPCQGLAAGTALVGNGPSAGLYELEEVTVELGYTGDQFARNMLTILAETRVTSGVTRPSAWKLVTGLPVS